MDELTITAIVVEDEKRLARNIAKHIGEIRPFVVTDIFSNGEDAWNAIQASPPQVVITDISMPVMDGIELAERIFRSGYRTRCVILTGYADFQYAQAALRADVTDYLLKPVDDEELKRVLKKIELSILSEMPDVFSSHKKDPLNPEEIVSLVKQFVQKHYKEDISLNVLAKKLGYSPSYLTKVFNRIEGVTPSSYLREYRMNIARQLLKNPSASVNAVAEAVGYPDPFHFSKSFKQTFGYPPSECRRSSGE